MSPSIPVTSSCPKRFPRVSGDEPSYGWDGAVLLAFSPRERG